MNKIYIICPEHKEYSLLDCRPHFQYSITCCGRFIRNKKKERIINKIELTDAIQNGFCIRQLSGKILGIWKIDSL